MSGVMTERCPKCSTPLKHAGGIGDFCPNKACDVRDNIDGVEWGAGWPAPATSPSVWRGMDRAPKQGPVLLHIGETIPDMPDVRVGSFIDGAAAEHLGYRECAKYGGWLIWSDSGGEFYIVDVTEPRGWFPVPEET